MINLESLKSIDPRCRICKGKCWHAEDQKRTQEEAHRAFGITPNHCVNSLKGTVACPYANGLL